MTHTDPSISQEIRNLVNNEMLDKYLEIMDSSEKGEEGSPLFGLAWFIDEWEYFWNYWDQLDMFFIKPSNLMRIDWLIDMDGTECRILRAVEEVYWDEKNNS